MDQGVGASLFTEAHHLSRVREADGLLERFESGLRRFGASHVLLTGLPLPRRTVTRLIVRIVWPDCRNGGHVIDVGPADPLIGWCLAARRPFVVRAGRLDTHPERLVQSGHVVVSELLAAAGGGEAVLVAVPIHGLPPWQGCVLIAGRDVATTPAALSALDYYCLEGFRALVAAGRLEVSRPGDLSDRERRVLELTSIGKTAAEIADLLSISQRTVHAHLQNASDKMNASNKTHTVVEAVRYGQIRI